MTRLSSSALLAGIATLVLAASANAQPLTTRPATAPSVTTPSVTTPSVTTPSVTTPSATTPPIAQPSVTAGAGAEAAAPGASASASASTAYSDTQISSFAAASAEIQPLTNGLATATPEQRTQATTQIRAALARHNIDSATYNAIASAAQNDTALAARINAARSHG